MLGPLVRVYDYLDYRSFLRDYYRKKKQASYAFSFRAFSARAKLSSPNHIKRVIDGDRNLTAETARNVAAACGLAQAGQQYFCDLVAYDQASDEQSKAAALKRLSSARQYQRAHRIDMAHEAYHDHWYIPAIRELIASESFRNSPEWIAEQLLPPISASEAKYAIDVLLDLGLVESYRGGVLRQVDHVVATEAETRSRRIANYHRQMLQRASDAISAIAPDARDISSVTLLLDNRAANRLKRRIQRFRRELIEMSLSEDNGDRVVQVNVQLFPLSIES